MQREMRPYKKKKEPVEQWPFGKREIESGTITIVV